MRRLWAHVLIAFTCIAAVFAAFPSVVNPQNGFNTNGDYSKNRRQFTFQLREKKQEDVVIKSLNDDSAKEMATIMEERLIAANVTSYEISTEGNDIINVAFYAGNDTKYRQITTYLGFSGSFALMNIDEDSEPIPAKDFINGQVYLLSDINQYPTVVIPVNTDGEAYKNLIEWARKEENQVESEADEDGNTTKSAPLYILYNFVEGDTYKTLNETNKLNEKILISLDALTDDSLYYNDDHNSFAQVCGYSDSNGNGYADASEVAAAYDQADFLYNLFTASALDYDVDVIKGFEEGTKVWLEPKVEKIFNYDYLAFNGTLSAIIAAIVILSLLLVVFYRLGSISVITTTLVSSFLTLLFMFLAGMEYNVLGVVAIIMVAALSLISGVIYFSKLKDEAYRGRTLKKANSEAARKSTLPIVDIHVVAILIGLMVYLLGGSTVHTFASLLILGSLAGLIINTLGLRGLAWLITNTTAFTGKYHLFAIEEDKVPNHMADEKQTYFGPYQDKDVTKNKKPIAIVSLALFVLSFAGVIVMGSLNSGYLLKNANQTNTGSQIYVVDTIRVISDEESNMNVDVVNEMFANIKVYENSGETVTFTDEDTHRTLESYVSKVDAFVTSDSETIEGTTYNYSHYYFVAKLNAQLDGDKLYAVANGFVTTDEMSLNELLDIYFSDINNSYDSSVSNTMVLKTVTTYGNKQLTNWGGIALGTFIAVLISTVYLMIRYRLSRGLATLLFPVVATTIALGITLIPGLLGLALPSEVYVLIPFTAFVSSVFMVLIANKERELVLDDKSRDNSYEHREELSKKSLSIVYTAILSVAGLLVFLPISFFGFGPQVYSYLHLGLILGLALSLVIVSVLYVPCANLLYKWFSKIDFNAIKPRKAKKTNKVKQKSAEPEEAVFIGIND